MTQLIPAWVNGILQPVEKMEVHRKGYRHPAISVFLMDGDKTLLQRRAAGKYHCPGLWANACCSHPKWGETAHDAAHRRVFEELRAGMSLKPLTQLEYRADVGGGLIEHEVVDAFVGQAGGLTFHPNPEEVSEVRWVQLDDLAEEIAARPDAFAPWLRIYVRDHAEALFGRPLLTVH